MLKIGISSDEQLSHLVQVIAKRVLLSPKYLYPFADIRDLLPGILTATSPRSSRLISVGHISPDITIAADKAGLTVTEALGVSPFSANIESTLSLIGDGTELIYLANPNRVTGANLGLADIESLAKAVPFGYLLIDEYYFEYFGITGLPLLERYSNVGMLRSFATAFGIDSSDAGYFAAHPNTLRELRAHDSTSQITTTVYRTSMICLENDAALDGRLKLLHSEAMRVSTELTKLGVQNRITAADFLLLRVKDPVGVGNHLARHKVPVENLDGYPLLKGYLRYKVLSPLSNDRMLGAFEKIPPEMYRLALQDRRTITMKHSGEEQPVEQVAKIDRNSRLPDVLKTKGEGMSGKKATVSH